MAYKDRELKILELLDLNESLSYQQLSQSLDVSEATIRRDLTHMSEDGLLVRTWGGARRNPSRPVRARNILEGVITDELRFIGECAGALVQDGELVFIGSGLTTLTMIDSIQAQNLTVITNGIPQLEALKKKGINAFLLCGFLKEYSRAVVGPQTVAMLSDYRFDKAFIGVNGIDENLDLLSADAYEDEIKRAAVSRSKKSFVLAAHCKFHRSAMYTIRRETLHNTVLISDQKMSETVSWAKSGRAYFATIAD